MPNPYPLNKERIPMKVRNFMQEFVMREDRPFDSCHASTLLKLKDGGVLTAYFGGSWEKSPDTAIWVSRRCNDSWEPPRVAADVRGIAVWNPVLFRLRDGRIRLFFKAGKEIQDWKTYYADSCDEGETFSGPAELVPGDLSGGRGPVKNKPIRLRNGTVIAPASIERDGLWDAFADISEDDCANWEKSSPVPIRRVLLNQGGSTEAQVIHRPYDRHLLFGKGMIQPALWEDENGQVHMLCRTTSSRIFRSDSADGGHTWSLAYDTGLPNNNSGIDLCRLPNGVLALAYNPRENLPGYYKGPRTPLEIAVSQDNGRTFHHLVTLEDQAGNFAYPAIIADENRIMVTYTWNRERIRYCEFALE